LLWLFWRWDLMNFLSWLAWNHAPPDLSVSRSWDYRSELPHAAPACFLSGQSSVCPCQIWACTLQLAVLPTHPCFTYLCSYLVPLGIWICSLLTGHFFPLLKWLLAYSCFFVCINSFLDYLVCSSPMLFPYSLIL
jgi:hypothetical protein